MRLDLLRNIGITLLLVSLIVPSIVYLPLLKHEVVYQIRQVQPTPKITTFESKYPEFGLVIPKLDINAKVIPDIDSQNSAIYQKALTQGVAHAEGTATPLEKGTIFIFAHSSASFLEAMRYNSIFYLLPKLEVGNPILLYYQGKQYQYLVTEKKIVDPTDNQYLTTHTEDRLVLMTCYPPGLNSKRFIVIAKPH